MTDHLKHTYDPDTDGIICAATLVDAAADPALTLDIARELLREAAEAIRCLHQYCERKKSMTDHIEVLRGLVAKWREHAALYECELEQDIAGTLVSCADELDAAPAAMGGQGEGRYPCPRGGECRGRDCPDCANFTAPQQPATQGEPAQQPLTDEHKAILKECRNQAMWWTLKARIPECGAFGGIAQDLDYLCGQLGLEEQEEGK